MASIISAGTTSSTALNMSADTSGVLQLASNNGTIAVTVDTSQNVGIGTASPATKLDVIYTPTASGGANNNTLLSGFSLNGASTTQPISAFRFTSTYFVGIGGNNYANQWVTDSANALSTEIVNTGATPIVFGTNATERMRITSGGLVGIGVVSPATIFHINGSSSLNSAIYLQNQSTSIGVFGTESAWLGTGTSNNLVISAYGTNSLLFGTAGSEKMRLDSSGNLLVGTTSNSSVNSRLYVSGSNFMMSINGTNTSGEAVRFYSNGTTVGTISYNGSSTAYNTSSDKRLKTLIGVSTDTSVIDKTVVNDFTWKADGTADRGVFAQDAYLVKPSAVKVGDNETEITDPWGVDYSKYVPDLIVYCQQLKARVEALETQLGVK
jgi:hypothetical protein